MANSTNTKQPDEKTALLGENVVWDAMERYGNGEYDKLKDAWFNAPKGKALKSNDVYWADIAKQYGLKDESALGGTKASRKAAYQKLLGILKKFKETTPEKALNYNPIDNVKGMGPLYEGRIEGDTADELDAFSPHQRRKANAILDEILRNSPEIRRMEREGYAKKYIQGYINDLNTVENAASSDDEHDAAAIRLKHRLNAANSILNHNQKTRAAIGALIAKKHGVSRGVVNGYMQSLGWLASKDVAAKLNNLDKAGALKPRRNLIYRLLNPSVYGLSYDDPDYQRKLLYEKDWGFEPLRNVPFRPTGRANTYNDLFTPGKANGAGSDPDMFTPMNYDEFVGEPLGSILSTKPLDSLYK